MDFLFRFGDPRQAGLFVELVELVEQVVQVVLLEHLEVVHLGLVPEVLPEVVLVVHHRVLKVSEYSC